MDIESSTSIPMALSNRQLSFLCAPCLALVAVACAQPQSQPDAVLAAPAATCAAAPAQFAVGYILTDAVVLETRRRSHADLARVIRPGEAVTMDFNPERVNIKVDAGNRVQEVSCG